MTSNRPQTLRPDQARCLRLYRRRRLRRWDKRLSRSVIAGPGIGSSVRPTLSAWRRRNPSFGRPHQRSRSYDVKKRNRDRTIRRRCFLPQEIPDGRIRGCGRDCRYRTRGRRHACRCAAARGGCRSLGGTASDRSLFTWTITPTDLHYERSHSGNPDLDPAKHRLLVQGMTRRRRRRPAGPRT